MTSTDLTEGRRHIAALDGIRGIAILLVLYRHLWRVLFNGSMMRLDAIFFDIPGVGWIGVDLFFVLSGFLITGILIDAKDGARYFRNFYARRFLRIFPLYYGFLFVLIVVLPFIPALRNNYGLEGVQHYQLWYWTYLQNLLGPLRLFSNTGNLWAGHLWSLAIEEQFYVLWPAVVFLCSRRTLTWVCIACVVGAPLLRFVTIESEMPRFSNTLATLTFMPARVDTLAAGALVAIAWREPLTFSRYVRPAKVIAIAALIIVTVYALSVGDLDSFDLRTQQVTFSTLALGFAAFLILVLAAPPTSWLQRACTHPVLGFFGRYSYGLYVIHFPIATQLAARARTHDLIRTVGGSEIPAHIVFMLVTGGLSVAAAWLSWHLYESQFLKLKRYFRYQGARRPGPRTAERIS